MIRIVAVVGFAFVLLVLQSTLGALFPLHPFAPHLLLPIVIYLGVRTEVQITHGAAVAFILGYLLDSFSGNAMGLQTFVMVATFLLIRGAGLRLFLRGAPFQMVMTFLVGVLDGAAILALRAIFERRPPFSSPNALEASISLSATALTTAFAAPGVFFAIRKLDALLSKRREEIGASAT